MADHPIGAPADAAQREAALDIRRSVLVEAPAGSGKTDLLSRRFLRLLAVVDEPEEILAITFTRAATAEMRSRILSDLDAAAGRRPFGPDAMLRMPLAREALDHAERRGWNLLDQPQRLVIETIDSLCLRIARDRPLLANLGGRLQPTENARPLHRLAARRTLAHLGGPDPELDQALAHLLDLRDNRLPACEDLLAGMLAARDQWQYAFPLSRAMSNDDWDEARLRLEAPFRREMRRVLSEAHRILSAQPAVAEQLLQLARYARAQGNEALALLDRVESLSPGMPREHWLCLCDLLLTEKGEWRKTVNVRQGFPINNKEQRQRKEAMLRLLEWLQHVPQLLPALCAIRHLPPAAYSPSQWITLRHIFTVLRHAVAELRIVFAEHNAVDFTEVSLSALEVLHNSTDHALALGGNIRHLLIDEFQDTSRRQHELVIEILRAWDPGEHRTVFLVGDPMQSIYMFRQAEVELFTQVRDRGIGPLDNRIHCDPVRLSVNFRSHAGLTAPLNDMFAAICQGDVPPGAAAVDFAPAAAKNPAPPVETLHIHPQIIGSSDRAPTQGEKRLAREQEARTILTTLEEHLPLIAQARSSGSEYRVAVLVRARPHLAELIPLLRERRIPFRAVEIEHLADRQELLDLLSLTRALLQPMDRIAWLAVLRAPWCGLSLADLHRLTGCDDRAARHLSLLELMQRYRHSLSPDGQQRLARAEAILRRALDLRWNQSESPSFSSWIERAWRTLGGPACLDAAGCENAEVFFSLLDTVSADGRGFESALEDLFAQPDPSVSERCGIQLMTIHRAKGLGFEVVIVPGLDRKSSTDRTPLVCSLERVSPWDADNSGATEFLVAPIGLQGEAKDPLFEWVRCQRKIRFDEERKRLFYVACTRARRELHLLGTAIRSAAGVAPVADSLLHTAWAALRPAFEAADRQPGQPATAARILPFPLPGVIEELAAVADPPSLPLRRLATPPEPPASQQNVTVQKTLSAAAPPSAPPFLRPEGSRHSRIIGSVVHTLLQRLGSSIATIDAVRLRAQAGALLRAAALTGDSLTSVTDLVTNLLLACAADPVCRWILAPHPAAQSEVSWSGFLPRLGSLRADRVFRAGPEPLADGAACLWIIDYKTAAAPPTGREQFLAAERALYAQQLRAYARAARAVHGETVSLRLGLYYPTLTALDWWEDEPL